MYVARQVSKKHLKDIAVKKIAVEMVADWI